MLTPKILRLTLLVAMSALILAAQTGSGTVQGVVKDASSAVIAGARVTIVHTATTRTYSTTTNSAGFFSFPPAQPGPYEISAEAAGMQNWQGKFLLEVGQTTDISPVLSIGAVTTQVSVVADATPLVTTSNATQATVLERTRIEQLPMNGRSIVNLMYASTPGLSGNTSGKPMVYGLRTSMEMLQDGAVIVNRDTGDFGGRAPGVDTVEEFRVETSLSSAKFNRPASMILSTRSGTNKIHGSLFETVRNSGIGVARKREDFYIKPPYLNRHEFGGSVGGPVVLPKLYNGRNRTFFFTSYEAQRSLSNATFSTSLATLAMRQGDFSGLVDGVGRRIQLYDPSTTDSKTWQRTPFLNNQIPLNRESPFAKYMYNVMPAPTNGANPEVDNNYFGLWPTRARVYTSTTRIDHRFGDRDQIFGRFTAGDNVTANPFHGVPSTDYLLNYIYNFYREINSAGSWTHSFSPTFLSETLVTYQHHDMFVGPTPGSKNVADALGMPNPQNNPWLAWQSTNMGFPAAAGTATSTPTGGLTFQVQQMRQNFTNILSVDQNFTRIHGRHEIQFGGRLRHEHLNVLSDQPFMQSSFSALATGLFDPSSGSAYAAVPQTGEAAASMFLGAATNYIATVNRGWYYMRDREYAGYVQDNWRVNSNLTLNLGLRYENLPAFRESNNFRMSFDPATKAVVLGQPLDQMYKNNETNPDVVAKFQAIGVKFETPSQAGLPASLVQGNPWNFAPRLGFAYKIGQTHTPFVLRGGYGTYHSQVGMRLWENPERSVPPVGYQANYSVNNQATTPDRLPNYELRSVPLYVAGANTRDILNNADAVVISPGATVNYAAPHQAPNVASEWNFSVERQILPGTVAAVSYVGTHGAHLQQVNQYNDAPSSYVWYVRTGLALPTGAIAGTGTRPFDQTTYGSINEFVKTGYSNDNAFQLKVQRRYSRGYGFEFFYVMTNAFTNTDLIPDAGSGAVTTASTFLPGAVPQNFDELNRFLYYRRDVEIPKHQVRYNWVVDLPFGQGKPLGHNAGKFLNRVIGGWQVAGLGTYRSNYWSLPTTNWGPIGKVEVYGTKYPIQDCRSGTCIPGYLYWNGYIPANRINSYDSKGQPNGVMGVPQDYHPAQTPLTPIPANGGSAGDPNARFYDTNNVNFVLKNGSTVLTSVDTGLHPWRNQYVRGPGTFSMDASLFKAIAIREAVFLRFNADFFNVLNHPGLTQPGSNGILSLQTSQNAARVLQLTLRLTW